MAKLEKQLWNNFCNFILRFACGSFLGLSNGRRQSASAIDNVIEFNSGSSADLTLEKSKKSNHRSISIPDMSKRARNAAKPKPSKSFGDIGTCGQKLEAFPSPKNRKESFKSKELQCDEIELHLGTKCNKHHDINAVGYHTSEESIFGMVNTKSSDSSSDSKRYGDLFKPSDSLFTIAECFKASNQNHEARSPVETQSKYKIYPPPVFQLNIVNVDTKLVDPVKENLAEVAEESSEQYSFESLEDKPIDDEHVLRLRLLWLKSGLRKHRSKLSHLKIVPIRDGDELKRPSMTSEAPPSPILKKIGAKPFDFEIVKEGRRKLFEKEEESESASSESTKTERRDAFTPIAQLVNVLGDKGKERFEICAIVSVSSDSEEEGMEFAKAIESEEGMKALLKTMEVVPREIPKLKGVERIALKTSEGSEVKVDDMDMTYTSSKLMVTVPLPKKERKEQNIDCLEQLKRKLAKIFSKGVSSTGKGDIDVVYEEGRLQSKHSHVIIDTSNKAYNDRIRTKDETKRKFPTFKEIVGTLPGNIRDVPKKRQKTKLPILKGFTRTFSDKFKRAEQKIRLDSELPEASKELIISNSDQRKCSCKQNDDDGDDREDVQEELHEFLRFERSAMRGNRRISTEMKIEEIRTKLRKVLEDDDRVKTTKHKTRGIGFKALKEKSKIPIRRAQEKLESRSQKPHQKLNALLNRLSNKLKETNDKIKQSLETTTCKVAKRKRDRGEVDLIGLSKKLSQQDIPERKALGPPYPNGLELPKRSVSEENVPNQIRREIETRSFSNIRNEMNSKMGEVFRRSLEIKFRGVAKRERRADLTLRKLKGIAKTIANESQTTDECVCPRGNRQEIEDASFHSQSAITGGDPAKRNFQSQLNRKVPTGRLVCDCKELKALRQMTRRLGVKSEEPRPTYKKSESFEQTPTVRPRSEKTSTAKAGPSRVECTLYKFKVDQPRQRICQIKYCGIQHSVLCGEGTFFKKVKKCVPRKLNYCGLENYGSPKVLDKRQTYLTPRKISPVLQEEPFQVKPYLSPRETSPVKVESLQEVEPVQVKHGNTKNVCSSVSSSCLEQIPKGKVCAGECQTRNFCRPGYYIKHVRRTPAEEERPNVEVMPTSHGSENYIHPEPEASRSDQILKGEGCSSKCQNRSTCFEKYHVGTTPRDGNPSISEGRNKRELKVNRIELRQRKLSRPEVFGSAIDLNWPKFWQTYYTSSQNNVGPEILCPKSTKLKVEEDLFAFRLSRNNSRSSLIVEETPSYLLVPVRQSQENTLYLDRKRTLKMLYPVKSETGRPSSDSSAPSTSNHSLFKSKTVHVLPNNKFSRNYPSVNSACNLESSFLCTTFDKCSSSARSVDFFNLWDAQVWNALGLCPLTLQSYYRKQLRKLLKDESETPS